MSRPIYLDSNIVIKGFEADDQEAAYAWDVMDAIAAGQLGAVTSELTLAEVLTGPLGTKDHELAESYERLLQTGRGLVVVPVTRDILRSSAWQRAQGLQVRLPDAIHIATATNRGCPVFLSGDRRIRSCPDFEVIRLSPATLVEIGRLTA